MTIKFTKMHGLGNDFMVIDGINQRISLNKDTIKQLSNRHLGIGFDQLLLVEPSTNENCDFNYRIFNADGSEVGQCGNGARCMARFIHYKKLSDKSILQVATPTNQMTLTRNPDETVSVTLSPPQFSPDTIPLNCHKQLDTYSCVLNKHLIKFHAVNVGNPHAVILVDDCDNADVTAIGDALCHHVIFPEQANIGFMQIISDDTIKLRVFERGVGETQACGSGAVAAAVCAIAFHGSASSTQVKLTGGSLNIQWQPDSEKLQSIRLTGAAEFVFEGEII